MSIFDYLFDNEMLQRDDIDKNNRKIFGVIRSSRRQSQNIKQLNDTVDELALLCKTMYQYMEQQPDFDAVKFKEILKTIDASDGNVDGKLTKTNQKKKPTKL